MDFYPEPVGAKAAAATSFRAGLGGSAGNIACGLAKLGQPASLMTAVSNDPVGDFVKAQLDAFGVARELMVIAGGETRTSLAISESLLEGHQTVIYRNDASDFQITVEQVEAIAFDRYAAVVLTGTNFAKQPSRDAHVKALELAAKAGIPTILDIDYRPYSWASAQEASAVLTAVCEQCSVIIGNDEEFDFVAGQPGKGELFAQDSAASKALVIYKKGPVGAQTYAGGTDFSTGIFKVEALKPVGSGDAFMAGLLASLADGQDLQTAVTKGSACAAIVVGKVGCSLAMPNQAELGSFIANHPGMT